jgi:Leucine-rich repeat (LRR) protein
LELSKKFRYTLEYETTSGTVSLESAQSNSDFDLSGEGIISINLTPFEKSGIQNLNLSSNSISNLDLTPLAKCPILTELILCNNNLSSIDLSPLTECVSLEVLDISSNLNLSRINLTPLSCCEDLRILDLSKTGLVEIDLSPVLSLDIEKILVSENTRLIAHSYFNIKFLNYQFPNLFDRIQWYHGKAHFDFPVLIPYQLHTGKYHRKRLWEDIEEAYLERSDIASIDLTPLSRCTALTRLHLNHNHLKEIDLTPLQNCKKLEWIQLDFNDITDVDLAPLGQCSKLRCICLDNNKLDRINLTPLEKCSNLEEVTLYNNPNLNWISYNGTVIDDKDIIRQFMDIGYPKARKPHITLRFRTKSGTETCHFSIDCEEIQLNRSNIIEMDLTPLNRCSKLEILRLDYNQLKTLDLSPLSSCDLF